MLRSKETHERSWFVDHHGPMLDPGGAYGLGSIEVDDEDSVRAFVADDPAVKSGFGEIELHPMRTILGQTIDQAQSRQEIVMGIAEAMVRAR